MSDPQRLRAEVLALAERCEWHASEWYDVADLCARRGEQVSQARAETEAVNNTVHAENLRALVARIDGEEGRNG